MEKAEGIMNKVEVIKPKVVEYQNNRDENIQEILRVSKGVPICFLIRDLSFKSIEEFNTAIRVLLKTDTQVIAHKLPSEPINTNVKHMEFLSTGIRVIE